VARPSQFSSNLDDPEPDFVTVCNALKRLPAADRARILAWLCLYYDDEGRRYDVVKRPRISIDGIETWLVKIPKRRRKNGG
jgi:hypothetical protein